MNKTLKEYMTEEKAINRWMVLAIGLAGAFCGALGAVGFMIVALA